MTKYCRLKEDEVVCGHCKGNHESRTCNTDNVTLVCSACPGQEPHSTLDKNCPTYKYQKEICAIMATQNVSWPEAKKRITPLQTSFASMAKRNTQDVSVGQTNNGCKCQCNCIKDYEPNQNEKVIKPNVGRASIAEPIMIRASIQEPSMPLLASPAYQGALEGAVGGSNDGGHGLFDSIIDSSQPMDITHKPPTPGRSVRRSLSDSSTTSGDNPKSKIKKPSSSHRGRH